jgi:hypothetical protein
LLVEFALLRPFDVGLVPVFEHWGAALALTVVKPDARKTLMISIEKGLKSLSSRWHYVTGAMSTQVIVRFTNFDKL